MKKSSSPRCIKNPRIRRTPRCVSALCLLVAVAAVPLNAQVVFSESFENNSGVDVGFGDYNWMGFVQFPFITDTIYLTNDTASSAEAFVSGLAGAGSGNGYLYFQSTIGGGLPNAQLLFTEIGSLGVQSQDATEISFNTQGFNGFSIPVHAALRVAGLWYVTAAQASTPPGDWSGAPLVFDLTSASYSTIVDSDAWILPNPNAQLTNLSSASGLPSGLIEAVGFLAIDTSGNQHFIGVDNFTLSAVPEPSSALLGLIALCGFAFRRRR